MPKYLDHINNALSTFYHQHVPCNFTSLQGTKCVNTRSGHTKGHQAANGIVFAAGEYVSSYDIESESEDFRTAIFFNLEELLERLAKDMATTRRLRDIVGPEIHENDILARFYSEPSWEWKSHSICLCCLMGLPEHRLPCGHIFCSSCVLSYGVRRSKILTEVAQCPIHRRTWRRGFPFAIHMKSKSAGVRILALEA